MRILLTGGGSGGHVVPLLAVAHELKVKYPSYHLSYAGEKDGNFSRLVEESQLFSDIHYISAGKFRRYADESVLQKLFDVKTNALNIRDVWRTIKGIFEAKRVISTVKPDVLFASGGFVCVPMGIAARLRKIPIVTHDLDATPGLANKLIGRWAVVHATGLPADLYDYPKDKTVFVGIPVKNIFKPATTERVSQARKTLDIPKNHKVVFVTGGSQGSARINQVVKQIAQDLLKSNDTVLFHHTGKGNESLYADFDHPNLQTASFFDNFVDVATAADVIVSRAGANSMTEFGVLKKPVIVIPSPFLANGHQLKNAQELANKQAIVQLHEKEVIDSPQVLFGTIKKLLHDEGKRQELGSNLAKVTKPDAAEKIAQLLHDVAGGES